MKKNTLFALLLTLLVLTACQQTESNEPNFATEKSTLLEASALTLSLQQIVYLAEDALDDKLDGQNANGRIAACGSMAHDKASKSITIDFGSSCTTSSGLTLGGKLTLQYAGDARSGAGMSWNIGLNSFIINNYKFNGALLVVYKSKPAQNTTEASVSTTGLSVAEGGKSISISAMNVMMLMNQGAKPKDQADNTSQLTGSFSGKNSEEKSYTADITKELLWKGECMAAAYLPASGTMKVNIGQLIGQVDFGAGTCDDTFVLTYPSGKTETIEW